jgi:prepilin-type N-terminal cleavage/methylation domain-containing protein
MPMNRLPTKQGGPGFSLLEVLMALGLLAGFLAVTYGLFLSQGEAFQNQGRKVIRLQALRTALEAITRDIRLAGYPEAEGLARLFQPGWLPPAHIPSRPFQGRPQEAVTLVPGGALPDGVMILALLPGETNPTALSRPARAGDTTLSLALTSSEVSDQYRPGDLLVIGQPPEYAQVTRILGRELGIDVEPARPGIQGLTADHPVGTGLGELSLVSYAVFNDLNDPEGDYHEPGKPVLKRKVNGGGFEPLAEEIEQLKIRLIRPGAYELALEARQSPGRETEAERARQQLRLTTRSRMRN